MTAVSETAKNGGRLRLLFIGNSHTYFNDMPEKVTRRFRNDGYDCETVMLAHGKWHLKEHAAEPDVRFNILYGHYDYVILQEYGHPFGPEEDYFEAVRKINEWIREAGSRPVIYMTWAKKDMPENQPRMNAAGRRIAEEIGALLAPVGEYWWDYAKAHPETEMYKRDGSHASDAAHELAAQIIYETIKENIQHRTAGAKEAEEDS